MNKVVEVGRLTKDPELRYTQNNTPVCGFTIAVDRFVKAGEEKQADFFQVVAWSKTAEFCSKYFSKGRKIIVFGRLQNRTWDDTEGKKHYVTEIVADEVDFADSKKEDNGAGAGASTSAAAPAARSNPQNGAEPVWAQGAGQTAVNAPATAPANPPPQAGTQAAFPWVKGGA